MYPDFIGIGAQKAGTTWLSHNLHLHPQIWVPPLKEIHYFNEKINEPANVVPRLSGKLFGRRVVDRRWRRQIRTHATKHLRVLSKRGLKDFPKQDFFWDLRYYAGRPDNEWYASLFEPGAGCVTGEITPAYSLLEPNAIARVYEIMPQAKIIFMMRNPIERAWSQAVMQFSKAENRDITTVAERKRRRNLKSGGSRLRTDYLRTLGHWGSFYPEEQIFVGFLEDIHFFPEELLRRLYRFLGVDSSFKPPGVGQKIHSRSVGKMPANLATYLAGLYREEMVRLAERFGGYADFWLYCAERLLNDPPAEDYVPYPLWETPWWGAWTSGSGETSAMNSREAEPQSGPLSSIQPVT